MARRYQRSTLYQPPGTDSGAVQYTVSLADTLSSFSKRAFSLAGAMAAEKGAKAGEEAGLSGSFQRKSNVSAYGRAYNTAAEAAYVAGQQVDIEDSFSRFEDESGTDPAKYDALTDAYAKTVLQTAEPGSRGRLQLLMRARAVEGRKKVLDRQRIVVRDEQRTTITAGAEAMARQAARLMASDDPGADEALDTLLSEMNATIQAGVKDGVFLPSQAKELRDNLLATAQKEARDSRVSAVVDGVLTKYRTDFVSGVATEADLDKLGLDAETRAEVQKGIREGVNLLQDERKRAHAEEIASLHQDIADGVPSDGAEREAFRLYRRGALEVDQYGSVLAQITRARVERAKRDAEEAAARAAFDGNTPLDPKDSTARKAMDALFKAKIAGVPRGSPQWQNEAIEMARRTNIIPTDAVSWARTVTVAGDPVAAATASDFLRRIEESNPAAFQYIEDTKLLSFAAQVSDATRAGTPSDVAVEVAKRNTFDLSDAEREAYRKKYQQDKVAKANASSLQSFLDSDDRYDRTLFGGAPKPSMALNAEFDSAVERYYAYTGGDAEMARNLAWRDVQRTWAYSEVNGQPELLKYAPEAMFPGLKAEDVRRDVAESVAPLGVTPDAVRLIPSAETARTGGLVWQLGTVNEYGAVDLVLGQDGRPQRYEVPVRTEDFARVTAAKARENVAKAREHAERERSTIEILREQAIAGDDKADALLPFLRKPSSGVKANDAAP